MRWLLALLLLWPSLALAAPSMRASDWSFRYSHGVHAHPVQTKQGWGFRFPAAPGSVHMLTTPVAGIQGRSITVTGSIKHIGPAVYNYKLEPGNTCISPYAQAHLYIERAVNNNDYDRFWSNPLHIDLRAGAFAVTVPLNATNWTSVYGHRNAARLADTLRHARQVGLTYGGGCFFGHGVQVRGVSLMSVTRYHIN